MLRSCCLRRRIGDGLLWHSALKPHASGEFSIAVVQANSNLEDQSQVYDAEFATYVGVYDGHGGPVASRFVNHHLFLHLQKFSKEQGGLSTDVIKRAFNAAEEDFTRLVKISLPTNPKIASVGSCCLQFQNYLIEPNLDTGYCQNSTKNKKHKPELSSAQEIWVGDYSQRRGLLNARETAYETSQRLTSDGVNLQGIAKRLVAAAIQEAAKKREVRYKDIKKMERGIRRHFHDDITVIVIYLDHQKHKQGAVGSTTPPIDIYSHNSDEAMGSSGDKIFPNEELQAKVLY
ncbi:probable protein phosphatase 2C 63 [Salvia splendens]|uniref:probable protein phosphatase 2C 63 n=1 Tax=Salvia splendens TaxID=180675 RepID=UPI001C26B646|nr:probable protein phosphatase 2C 63 [Salvia splendens]